jgi:hypothetical protein
MSELNRGYSIIKMLGGLHKRIDDKNALLIAKHLFDIEERAFEETRIYTVESYIREFLVYVRPESYGWWFDQLKIALNIYAITDDLYLYYANFGYDPENNIVVYAKDIMVKKI